MSYTHRTEIDYFEKREGVEVSEGLVQLKEGEETPKQNSLGCFARVDQWWLWDEKD